MTIRNNYDNKQINCVKRFHAAKFDLLANSLEEEECFASAKQQSSQNSAEKRRVLCLPTAEKREQHYAALLGGIWPRPVAPLPLHLTYIYNDESRSTIPLSREVPIKLLSLPMQFQ